MSEIYLAGGCFWGTQAYIKRLPGVRKTEVGYANGQTSNPTYEEVCRKNTGFAETVLVFYDPEVISLKLLLRGYFQTINPTTRNRQGNDVGSQYRSGIYYTDPVDVNTINEVISEIQKAYKDPVVTEVLSLVNYYPAEPYHQDYLDKHPDGYCHVDIFEADRFAQSNGLTEQETSRTPVYPVPTKQERKKKLTRLQYEVTQKNATEPPFRNLYSAFFERGIYVDVVTGEPLFTSMDKFESGCGWPSFSKPVKHEVVAEYEDLTHGMKRTEVRSRLADSHLGHVFADGPKETGGLRYCINSAALDFIPYKEMEKKGYAYLKYLFE